MCRLGLDNVPVRALPIPGKLRVGLVVAIPPDEEHNQERREDGHGCKVDRHASMVRLGRLGAISTKHGFNGAAER